MKNAVRNEARTSTTARRSIHDETAVANLYTLLRNALCLVISFTLVCGLLPILPSAQAYADEIIIPDEVAKTAQVAKDEVLITYEDEVLNLDENVAVSPSGVGSNDASNTKSNLPSEETTLQDCGVVGQEEVVAPTRGGQGAVTVAQLDTTVTTEKAIEQLEATEGIASVQPNYVYSLLTTTTSDTYAVNNEVAESNQYYLFKSGVVDAWDHAKAKGSVTVATIDTGCNLQHEDLRGTVDSEHAYDVTTQTPLSEAGVANSGDAHGHGTLVAGVIAAQANNSRGIAGASYNAKVLPIKVFNNENQCTTADLIAAYGYLDTLLDQGKVSDLRVINMSLGYYSQGDNQADEALHSAITAMRSEHNVLTVCAGGNGDSSGKARTDTCYPSDFKECLSVTALDKDGSSARFSDYNSAKDISAYGVDILSTTAAGGYAGATGTSMAAPQVAAAAALLWAADNDLTAQYVASTLKSTATEIEDVQPGNGSAGALNAQAAVASVLGLSVDESADESQAAEGMNDEGSANASANNNADEGTTNEEASDKAANGATAVSSEAEANDKANSWRYTDGELNRSIAQDDGTITPFANDTLYAWKKNGSVWSTTTPFGKSIMSVSNAKGFGVDVSYHNGTINWGKAKKAGVDFVIIRCGYGGNYSSQDDSQFLANVKGCVDNKIPFGLYLYSYADSTARASSEADHVIRLLNKIQEDYGVTAAKIDYPIYYDLEEKSLESTKNQALLANMAKTFCQKIEDAGYTPGVYANRSWFTSYLIDPCFDQWSRWIAQYPLEGKTNTYLRNANGSRYTGAYDIWQCMQYGTVDGISERVDINFNYGAKIGNNLSKAAVKSIDMRVYTGKEIKPEPLVKIKGKTLKKNTDYTLSYSDNINAGKATITIKGKGSYTGTKKVTFKITRSLSDASISSVGSRTYTGAAIKPVPTVKLADKTLKNGTDFTLSYKNNKNVGKATITITGKGVYTGSRSITFAITKANLSKASISGVGTKTYTGKSIKPAPTVKLSGNKLKNGGDYTVSYKNNVRAGTATVTVKAKGGNCTGSKSITFRIKPAQVTNVKVSSPKKSKITVKWSNGKGYAANVTGYKIVVKYGSKTIKTQYVSGRLSKTKTITLASKYRGKKVKTYVYAYKTINKAKVCSSASSAKSVTVKR